MKLYSETITTPPRAAATVVMLRDSVAGLEVLLLKRHALSDVLGDTYVFPGGKVDLADSELDMSAHLDLPLQAMHASLNEPDIAPLTAASLYVAALREAFEESGILFAHEASAERTGQAAALLQAGHTFGMMLAQLGLRLQSSCVQPWSRWITPTVPSVTHKRFDTRFFVAAVPAHQIARHDDHEATESHWLRPRTALERYWSGDIQLVPPQIMSLVQLARHADVHSVLQAARERPPPVIEPAPHDVEGSRIVCYPGDERHPVRARALPGPTRLIFRNQRFEPVNGFEGLFDEPAG